MIARYESPIHTKTTHLTAHRYRDVQNIPHWHTEHELVYSLDGITEIMVNNSLYHLSAGESAFIRSGEVHYIKAEFGAITNIIKIDADYVDNIIQKKVLVSPILKNNYSVDLLYNEIKNELKSGREYSGIIAESIITKLIAQIFRDEKTIVNDQAAPIAGDKYKNLLKMLAKNYQHMSFDDAAKYMNFSRPYFSKYFKQHFGMTFTRYLNILKVEAAVEKIAEGELTLTEISIMCGFGTIRNFNRIFKAFTGYSPTHLPDNYTFVYSYNNVNDQGFNPTLNVTEFLE